MKRVNSIRGRSSGGASRRGVTATELLVGIVVLSALAVLFLPALSSATKAADQAGCVSNLKQLAAAIQAYSAENDGFFPPGNSPYHGKFNTILSPYLAPMKSPTVAADVFYCPANEREGSPPADGYVQAGGKRYKGWSGYFQGYVMNTRLHPIEGVPVEGQAVPTYRIRQNSVRMPSKVVDLLDMRTRAPGTGGPPSSSFATRTYFDPKSASFGLGLVHYGKGNILFADGHVQSFDGSAPLQVQSYPDRDTTMWP